MTRDEIDKLPLDKLCAPISAKVMPLRCRFSPGINSPLTDGQLRVAHSNSAAQRTKMRQAAKWR